MTFKSSRFIFPTLNNSIKNDFKTNQIYEKDPNSKHPFAELTKIPQKTLKKDNSLVLEHFSDIKMKRKPNKTI